MSAMCHSKDLSNAAMFILLHLLASLQGFTLANNAETKVTGKLGDTVILPCVSTLRSPVNWNKVAATSDGYICNGGVLVPGLAPRFQLANHIPGVYNLIINDVQLNDSGRYRCVENSGIGDEHFIVLNVVKQDSVCSDNVQATQGARVTLCCRPNIDKPVIWFFTGSSQTGRVEVSNSGKILADYIGHYELNTTQRGNYHLVIKSAQLQDAGQYVCQEENGIGVSHRIDLNVSGFSFANEPETKVTGKLGGTVILPCVSTLRSPVNWRKQTATSDDYICIGGVVIPYLVPRFQLTKHIPGVYSLIINDVQLNDSGRYRCIENSGTGDEHVVVLNVVKQVSPLALTTALIIGVPLCFIFLVILLTCLRRHRAELSEWCSHCCRNQQPLSVKGMKSVEVDLLKPSNSSSDVDDDTENISDTDNSKNASSADTAGRRQRLIDCQDDLARTMKMNEAFLSSMMKCNTISLSHKRRLKDNVCNYRRESAADELLDMVVEKGDRAVALLIEELVKNDEKHLARKIDPILCKKYVNEQKKHIVKELAGKRHVLVKDLDLSETLLSHMFKDNISTWNQKEKIEEMNKEQPKKAIGRFFGIVQRQGIPGFRRLIEALVLSNQHQLAEELDRNLTTQFQQFRQTTNVLKMAEEQQHALDKCRPSLIKDLDLSPRFIAWMRMNVLTLAMEKEIANGKEHNHVSIFLNHLEKQGKRGFNQLLVALEETQQTKLLNKIKSYLQQPAEKDGNTQEVETSSDEIEGIQSPNTVPPGESQTLVKGRSGSVEKMEIVDTHACACDPEIEQYRNEVANGKAEIEISFETLTEEDHKRQAKNAYPMTHQRHGRVLIINNEFFQKTKAREGTKHDELNLRNLFEKLNFKVEVEKNKSVEDIQEILEYESQRNHSIFDMFVLVILSHGSRGIIYGVDNKTLSIDEIVSYFDANKCKTLKGKPKIFIIQACQGEMTAFAEADSVHQGVHNKADQLIAYSTIEGYNSWRIPHLGSCYIRSLVYVFKHHAHEEHVLDMLTRVNGLMESWKIEVSHGRKVDLLAEAKTRFRKRLYLYPGW